MDLRREKPKLHALFWIRKLLLWEPKDLSLLVVLYMYVLPWIWGSDMDGIFVLLFQEHVNIIIVYLSFSL